MTPNEPNDDPDADLLIGALAFEHQTGPSRGKSTWLTGPALDISLSPNRLVRVADSKPEISTDELPDDVIARLNRVGDSYEIEDVRGDSVWVNGTPGHSQLLMHGDMIEFGEAGPLSRFCIYCGDQPHHITVGDILSDSFTYLRVSRQPIPVRLFRVCNALLRRLFRETTGLFRIGVVISILVLAVLIYQQNQLNTLVQQRLEQGFSRLDSFANALARARKEALTPSDLIGLRQEIGQKLVLNAERLAALERRSEASARVVSQSIPSVLFIQGAYGFREKSSGRMLRQVVDNEKRVILSPLGQPMITLEGDGPIAERQYTGTGFAVGDKGALATNRHVALPWENDADVAAMKAQGLEPVMIKLIAYLPGKSTAVAVELVKASDDADLAVLRQKGSFNPLKGLTLADAAPDLGTEVVVMGYPTGLRSMLAQSGDAFIAALQKAGDTEFWSVGQRLAAKGFIAPLASRGIVGQATKTAIVYDAETTHGGSGGPVLDTEGRVVAVNAAILPEYGGSNLGVPASKLRELLKKSGM
jgi:S1-C subfamily serine protease